jgi:outer membrane protein assembly factor BamB
LIIIGCFSCNRADPDPLLSSNKTITSFSFKASKNSPNISNDYDGSITGDSIKFTVPFATNLTSLVPTIIHSGKVINPGNEVSRDFSTTVTYTVTAEDGSSKNYAVVVKRLSNSKTINSFIFLTADNPGLTNDCAGIFSNDSIYVTVPYGSSITALKPTIQHNGSSVNPANLQVMNFSQTINYVVTAEDATTKTYVVVVKPSAPAATLLINSCNSNSSGNGSIFALNAHTGQLRWKFTGSAESINSTNYFSNGIIYTGIGNKITAFDTVTKTIKWEYATGGVVYSSPMVVNGTVYMNSDDMYLYAINVSDGSLKWRFAHGTSISTGGNHSSPVVINNVVYFGSIDANVYAVDAVTGQLIWRRINPLSSGVFFQSSPCVVNGILYIGDVDHNLIAFNTTDGSYFWHYRTSELIYSSPTVSGNVVFVCSADNSLYALDAVTGVFKWKYTTPIRIYSSPFVADGVAYFGTRGPNTNVFYAINTMNGTLKWSYTHSYEFFSSPVVYGDFVYTGSYRYVLALDKNTGILKWNFDAGNFQDLRAGPIVVDQLNNIVVPSISGHRQ